MARIGGVNLPDYKHANIALTSIYGIGINLANKVCDDTGINRHIKLKELSEKEIELLRENIRNYTIEGDLRSLVSMNIKRLIDINSYRGIRHKRGLPVRGQRTITNARTRKGKRKKKS
mgnify:CR=1 FL=1